MASFALKNIRPVVNNLQINQLNQTGIVKHVSSHSRLRFYSGEKIGSPEDFPAAKVMPSFQNRAKQLLLDFIDKEHPWRDTNRYVDVEDLLLIAFLASAGVVAALMYTLNGDDQTPTRKEN